MNEVPNRLDRTIDITAPPERVWQALTDARELSAWFKVEIEGEIAAGSELWFTSTMTGYEGHRFPVRVVELTPPRRMVWQWPPGDVDPAADYTREPRTTVTFTLEPSPQGTRLSLSETGFDLVSLARRAKAFADNSQGWTEVLAWLQRHAEASR